MAIMAARASFFQATLGLAPAETGVQAPLYAVALPVIRPGRLGQPTHGLASSGGWSLWLLVRWFMAAPVPEAPDSITHQ